MLMLMLMMLLMMMMMNGVIDDGVIDDKEWRKPMHWMFKQTTSSWVILKILRW